MASYERKTNNGYDFFECSSAMQKCIRRGMEDEAMFWAVELFDSNYAEYVWKRLRIMSSEDIGLAEPNISANIWALYSMHVVQAKNKDDVNKPERLFLTHAIFMLCRAKKSRLIDWALLWHWLSHQFYKIPIPDFAYDKHNAKGKTMKRGWGHFFREGTLLENHQPAAREEEFRKKAAKAVSDPGGSSLFS